MLTKAGYNVALKPRSGSVDPDLAAAQLCETLARFYPDLEPEEIVSLARRSVPVVGGFGVREVKAKA